MAIMCQALCKAQVVLAVKENVVWMRQACLHIIMTTLKIHQSTMGAKKHDQFHLGK